MSGRDRGDRDIGAGPVAGRLAPREVEREARRLLPLLARKGGRLRLAAGGRTRAAEVTVRDGQRTPTAVADPRVPAAFEEREWVRAVAAGEWRIAPGGHAWLARREGGEEGFRAQHQLIGERRVAMPDGAVRPARVNEAESPLGWLRRHRAPDGGPFLSDEMVAAGERLRDDFTRARLVPGVTTDWSRLHRSAPARRGRADGAADLSDSALAARQRVERALASIGPELAGIVMDVCCFLRGLGESERARAWPQRSAKIVLRLALDMLARHYGLIDDGDRRTRRQLRAWLDDGARPRIAD